jgi:hypothetical protein
MREGGKEDIISGDHSSRDYESINLLYCGFYPGLPIPLMKGGTLHSFSPLPSPLLTVERLRSFSLFALARYVLSRAALSFPFLTLGLSSAFYEL